MSQQHPDMPVVSDMKEPVTLDTDSVDQNSPSMVRHSNPSEGQASCEETVTVTNDSKIVATPAPGCASLLPTSTAPLAGVGGGNFPMHIPASRSLTVPDADSGIEDEENSCSSSSLSPVGPPKCTSPEKDIQIVTSSPPAAECTPVSENSNSSLPPSRQDSSSTSPPSAQAAADTQHSVNNLPDLRRPEDPFQYSMDGVSQHNALRHSHGSPPLTHSERLRKMAQEYADYLSEARIGEQTQKSKNFNEVGENIIFVPYVCYLSAKQATMLWYRQLRNIDMSEVAKENFDSISSFSQIVWAGCESVGFGVSFGKRGGCYVVANYEPKMNLSLHNFLANVLPPRSLFTIREEQLEMWTSLLLAHGEKVRSSCDQQSTQVNHPQNGTNRSKVLKHWDQAVAVESAKQKMLTSIKPSD